MPFSQSGPHPQVGFSGLFRRRTDVVFEHASDAVGEAFAAINAGLDTLAELDLNDSSKTAKARNFGLGAGERRGGRHLLGGRTHAGVALELFGGLQRDHLRPRDDALPRRPRRSDQWRLGW